MACLFFLSYLSLSIYHSSTWLWHFSIEAGVFSCLLMNRQIAWRLKWSHQWNPTDSNALIIWIKKNFFFSYSNRSFHYSMIFVVDFLIRHPMNQNDDASLESVVWVCLCVCVIFSIFHLNMLWNYENGQNRKNPIAPCMYL